MPDILTQEEKAAIVRYEGPVYKAKTGESAFEIGEPSGRVTRWNKSVLQRRKYENEQIRKFRGEGMTDPQIAMILNMPASTIRTRRLRGHIP